MAQTLERDAERLRPMKEFLAQLNAFRPECEQEEKDLALLRRCLDTEKDLFTRQNPLVHLTASAWVMNGARDKVLMCFHKIYNSWSWLGGHADGDTALAAVALKEVREESGLSRLRLLSGDIYSLEALHVEGHIKRGEYVSSHIHMNVTYLIEADETEPLIIKEDENSGLRWFTLAEAETLPEEVWMRENIYRKLNRKLKAFP